MLPPGVKRWLVFRQHFRQIKNPDSIRLSDSGAVPSSCGRATFFEIQPVDVSDRGACGSHAVPGQ